MEKYDFANVRTMGMPTLKDLLDPEVLGKDVKHLINVSGVKYPKSLEIAIKAKGITCHSFPISKKIGSDWTENIIKALDVLSETLAKDECTVVHDEKEGDRCLTVVKAYYLMKTGEFYPNRTTNLRRYNHLDYNEAQGHFKIQDIVYKRNTENKAQFYWGQCMDYLGQHIDKDPYITWIIPILPLSLKDNVLTLGVPSNFFREFLEERFNVQFQEALRQLPVKDIQIEYEILPTIKPLILLYVNIRPGRKVRYFTP